MKSKNVFICFLIYLLILMSVAKAQWVQSNGPYGIKINALTSSGSTIYAGTNIGIFRSQNSGITWTEMNSGLGYADIHSLSFNKQSKIIYAGTGGGGVYCSSGTGWNKVSNGLPANASINSLASSGNNIYALINGQLFLSVNNGSNWVAVIIPSYITSINANENKIFLGSYGSGFLSTDSGLSWNPITPLPTSAAITSVVISETNIFAGTLGGGVFLSTNNGISWIALNNGLDNKNVSSLAISGINIVAVTSSYGVYFSTNNGANWKDVNNGLISKTINSLIISENIVFIGTNGDGIFRSMVDGSNLESVNNGLTPLATSSLITSGNKIFAGTSGVYSSTDNGLNWKVTELSSNIGGVCTIAINGNNIFVGTAPYNNYGEVFLSSDFGSNWKKVYSVYKSNVNAIAFSENNIFIGTGAGVFISNDIGINWKKIYGEDVTLIAINGSNIFVGHNRGGISLSTDNGISWKDVSNGLTNTDVRSLTISGNSIYAGTSYHGVYLSTDNGSNWNSINTSIQSGGGGVQAILVNGNSIFLGISSAGVFLSTDNGENWKDVNNGLIDPRVQTSTPSVNSLIISGNNIYAATGYGIWRRPLSEIVTDVEDKQNNLPTSFSLQQNYPNPFNPNTKIKFGLAENAFTKLIIYDILGREMETLLNYELNAGYHEVEFNASNLTSGVYFYRLQAGSYSDTKKFILMK